MTETRTCPFEGCEWSYESRRDDYTAGLDADFKAEQHYEREHAGRVRIQVALEQEQMLGDRDPEEIRERVMDRFESEPGYEVAYVRTEVLDEADDHDRIENREVPREDQSGGDGPDV